MSTRKFPRPIFLNASFLIFNEFIINFIKPAKRKERKGAKKITFHQIPKLLSRHQAIDFFIPSSKDTLG